MRDGGHACGDGDTTASCAGGTRSGCAVTRRRSNQPSSKCFTSCSTTPANTCLPARPSALPPPCEEDHYLRLSVTDEGPGIPSELREQVFQKFFRIPGREALDPRRAGIGLGLPIARRLVESQAGRIWIEAPESGRGTRVILRCQLARCSCAGVASEGAGCCSVIGVHYGNRGKLACAGRRR